MACDRNGGSLFIFGGLLLSIFNESMNVLMRQIPAESLYQAICLAQIFMKQQPSKRGKIENMTRPSSSMLRVLGVTAFLLMTFCYGYAQDDNVCSDKNLKGSFGFKITGTNGALGPFAFVGHFVADGEGNITGAGTEAILPVVGRNQPFAATYTVNADCTGSAVLTFTSPDAHDSARLDFVLVDDGKEIMFVDTDRGVVESGTAKKQFFRHDHN